MVNRRWVLPIIVISQFCCTSLWFAGNGVMNDLLLEYSLSASFLGHLTSSVQLGFISGTLVFALLTIADRFSPSLVFFVSSIIASLFNLGITINGLGIESILIFRFFTGFFLAGIYPVGMKIASDYYDKGLGKSLGYLVGALVVGTAFPHLLKSISESLPWRFVMILTSSIASLGGLIMLIKVPDGPFRKPGNGFNLLVSFKVFKNKNFRSAAFGYFGHMWELYAFWAFVPVILGQFVENNPEYDINISLISFFIIGFGGLGCIIGGYISLRYGAGKVAYAALLLSCICCLISPIIFTMETASLLIVFLIIWGVAVVTDSPQFSTMVANNASPDAKGTALTIVNCIGFSITIVSIQLINFLYQLVNPRFLFVFLAIGPVLGLIALGKRGAYSAPEKKD